jgi:hypothetical protein
MIAWAALVLGCSSGGSEPPSAGPGDGSIEADGGNADGGSIVGSGWVGIEADYLDGSIISPALEFAASFTAGGGSDSGSAASTVDAGLGSCTVSEQPYPLVASSDTFVSAGTITIAGAGPTFTLLPSNGTLTPEAGSSVAYQLMVDDAGAVTAGENFAFVASGAVAPAFSANIDVPGAIHMTQPDLDGVSPSLVIDRTAGVLLAWTGGGTGQVIFAINQTAHGMAVSLSCTYPETAGSGVVPADLLANLTPTSEIDAGSLRSTTLSLSTSSTETITTGGWRVVASITVVSLAAFDTQVVVQ